MLGLNENRSDALIDISRERLAERMKAYFDSATRLTDLPESLSGLTRAWARFDPLAIRQRLLDSGPFDESRIVRFMSKPFDLRWAYVDTRAKLWNEVRARLVKHASAGTPFIMGRRRAPKTDTGAAFFFGSNLADQHSLSTDAYLLPLSCTPTAAPIEQPGLFADHLEPTSSLSPAAQAYLDGLASSAPTAIPVDGAAIWLHALAIGYTPTYLAENADGIRQNWPRIPLPAVCDALLTSADLGRKIAALLDVEEPVDAVTAGSIRYELRRISSIANIVRPHIDPAAGDLSLTAGWGHAGKGGITMPGRGKLVERAYTDDELLAFREGLGELDLTYEQLTACLGGTCFDVYLNEVAYWRCVPSRVWSYTIGGYQVMKKWLSYRERPLLGRDLTPDEARYVTEMARRIAAILLLEPDLDANYERVKADTYEWPGST